MSFNGKSIVCLVVACVLLTWAWLDYAQSAGNRSTAVAQESSESSQTKEIGMDERRVGFAVIYRWKVKPGMEAQYQRGWERVTERLKADRGALGSRLHKMDDGTWVAYAQWPSRAAWERSRAMGPADPEGSRLMHEAEAEALPPMLLDPVRDFLEPVPIEPGG